MTFRKYINIVYVVFTGIRLLWVGLYEAIDVWRMETKLEVLFEEAR